MCIDGKDCVHQTSPQTMLRGKIMANRPIQNKLYMFNDKYIEYSLELENIVKSELFLICKKIC